MTDTQSVWLDTGRGLTADFISPGLFCLVDNGLATGGTPTHFWPVVGCVITKNIK